MELFHKIYGCYYLVVRHILEEAAKEPLTRKQIDAFAARYGFQESSLTIMSKLMDGTWPLLSPAGEGLWTAVCGKAPKMPLTLLQKSWLRALLSDRRIRLFLDEEELSRLDQEFLDTEPLFCWEDFHYFDRYRDGDDYDSPAYQENFRTILKALRDRKALLAAYLGKRGEPVTYEIAPYQIQYSAKDDKFRLCCLERQRGFFRREMILNLSRIAACHLSKTPVPENLESRRFTAPRKSPSPVVIAISGERNSLERCMLHFANYEKHTEYEEQKGAYICSIYYDLADETELLIDILSFGPVICVLGPESFLRQVRQRVEQQHNRFHSPV